MLTQEEIIEFIRPVEDPEIGASIVDVGLIYSARQDENGDVYVEATLTSPQCSLGPEIIGDVEKVLSGDERINNVTINIVFEPAWDPDRMTEDLKLEFGFPI